MLSYNRTESGKLYSTLEQSLKNFRFENIRNTNSIECINGAQFWVDIHRTHLSINGHKLDTYEIKKSYIAENPTLKEPKEYHKASSGLLDSMLNKFSGYKVTESLTNELIAILHQGGVDGSLYMGVTHHLALPLKEELHINDPNLLIVPESKERSTEISIMSPRRLRIDFKEQIEYVTSDTQATLLDLNCKLSFNVSELNELAIMYHGIVISIEVPKDKAILFNNEEKTISNILCSTFRKLHSQLTNSSLDTTSEIQRTEQENGNVIFTYQIPNNYQCSPIIIPTEDDLTNEIQPAAAAMYNSILSQSQGNAYQSR